MTLQEQLLGKPYNSLIEIQAMAVWQVRAMKAGDLRSCINCDNFLKASEECSLARGKRPPAIVIALGCDSWVMEMPF